MKVTTKLDEKKVNKDIQDEESIEIVDLSKKKEEDIWSSSWD